MQADLYLTLNSMIIIYVNQDKNQTLNEKVFKVQRFIWFRENLPIDF